MKFRLGVTWILFCTVCPLPSLWALDCGVPSSIQEGNLHSGRIFRTYVRDPRLVEATPREQRMPPTFVSASAFGAVGDGVRDDTTALQRAFTQARRVWLEPFRTYRISSRLVIGSDTQVKSNGTATIVMGRSGFNNVSGEKREGALYGPTGTGIALQGDNIVLDDFFIVKEYEDERFVIGLDIRGSTKVQLNRLLFRGFSLAPGIITLRSSQSVSITNTLIHASCSTSRNSAVQITGIEVDDTRFDYRISQNLTITNNVIVDLFHRPGNGTHEQSDGINFRFTGTGPGSVIKGNYIDHVAEAIDLFGMSISVFSNYLGARELAVKLIHGARSIAIAGNVIAGKPSIAGIRAYSGSQEWQRVETISIEDNIFDPRSHLIPAREAPGFVPGVQVDTGEAFPPRSVRVNTNRFLMDSCGSSAVVCSRSNCQEQGNIKLHEGVFSCE